MLFCQGGTKKNKFKAEEAVGHVEANLAIDDEFEEAGEQWQ